MPAWRDVPELPVLRPADGEAQHHPVASGDLILDDRAQIRERVSQFRHPRRDPGIAGGDRL
jgi:hypothetical protein